MATNIEEVEQLRIENAKLTARIATLVELIQTIEILYAEYMGNYPTVGDAMDMIKATVKKARKRLKLLDEEVVE